MSSKKTKKENMIKRLLNSLGHGFNMVAKIVMLIVCIGTGILSVFYTGTYMSGIIESVFIAFLVSGTMYAYGLIGLNYADVFRLQKRYIMSFVFYLTSICTILFSMSTSLMVNGEKYYTNKVETEQTTINKNSSNDFEFELLQNKLNEHNKEIERLEESIKTQEDEKTADRTWVIDEEHPDGYYKITSYTLTKDAKEKIDKFNELLKEEKEKREAVQLQLIELSKIVNIEKTEDVQTFTQMISKYLNINANYINLFMILFCSVFIDIISPLALMIAKNKELKEEEIKKEKKVVKFKTKKININDLITKSSEPVKTAKEETKEETKEEDLPNEENGIKEANIIWDGEKSRWFVNGIEQPKDFKPQNNKMFVKSAEKELAELINEKK